jgi:hypothetical protein
VAILPLRLDGSEIAPSFRSSFFTWVVWKSASSATTSPGLPFSIRFFATSTVETSSASFTLSRYWLRKTSRTAAASSALTPASIVVPLRVDSIFRMSRRGVRRFGGGGF